MQSNAARLAIGAGALIAVVILFVVLSGDDESDEPTTAPTTAATTTATPDEGNPAGGGNPNEPESDVATIVVENGQPVGGVKELSFTKGEDIQFVVDSDVADEVHLHGYDVGQDVEAGGKTEFDVPATIEGVFEVELEERVVPLAEITVNP